MTRFKVLLVVFLVACLSQSFQVLNAGDESTKLQGIWFGDGIHPLSRKVLIVEGDKFIVVTPLGVFVSKYKTNDIATLKEIDIERFDGESQLGVFEITDAQLRMKFAEPNRMRPTQKDVRLPNGKGHWHTVFTRRPTQEGLEVLSNQSDKLLTAQSKSN